MGDNGPAQSDGDDFSELYEQAEPLTQAEGAPSVPAAPDDGTKLPDDVPGASMLNALLYATPFTGYIHYAARWSYGHQTIEGRVAKYRMDHPRICAFCTIADLILRIVVVALILVTTSLVVYKALAPIDLPL